MRNDARKPFCLDYSLTKDDWLSGILGKSAWRLEREKPGSSLATVLAKPGGFAYAKTGTTEIALTSHLTDHGFRVIDTALTFEGLPNGAKSPMVRHAKPSDRDVVSSIAGSAFRFSRFHLDPRIQEKDANKIKFAWASNFFDGLRGNDMVVAEREGKVVGFLLLIHGLAGYLTIDLIGVLPTWQGQGIGREMIAFAAQSKFDNGLSPAGMLVGTQAANIPSVRLYESLGFRMKSTQFILHLHV